jgi:EAL domain-containing protein (putative c-di-GMP-specific phosphodiesterase class I)
VFEPVMHVAALDRLQLRAELQRAVRDGGVTLVYQPIVRVQDGEIAGVEALARWEHPARGVIPPDEFIPLAEQTGLIVPLGRALLREACLQAAALHAACPRRVLPTMSVNLSARQLQSPELVADVGRALLEARIPAASLVLELTESAMMEDLDLATRRLEELRDLGVSLAIDDFGRGYSSLNYIRRFPVDVLKIDRSFIADIAHGPAETKALIAAIMQLAAALSLKTVAEGIEDDDQLARLRELGCDLAQGYHLFRPMPGAQVEALLARAAARPVGAAH